MPWTIALAAVLYFAPAPSAPDPVPDRPPGWRGNWPPERFRDATEAIDCLEHILRLADPYAPLDLI